MRKFLLCGIIACMAVTWYWILVRVIVRNAKPLTVEAINSEVAYSNRKGVLRLPIRLYNRGRHRLRVVGCRIECSCVITQNEFPILLEPGQTVKTAVAVKRRDPNDSTESTKILFFTEPHVEVTPIKVELRP